MAALAVALLILPGCGHGLDLRTADLVGRWQGANGSFVPAGDDPPDFPLVAVTRRGPEHCDWESVIFLEIAWPVGSIHRGPHSEATVRQYVRDPDGKLAEYVDDPYDGSVTLSAFAVSTALHRMGNELFIDPAGDAYVRRPAGQVERWPHTHSAVVCA
jgi:hypothetical protein